MTCLQVLGLDVNGTEGLRLVGVHDLGEVAGLDLLEQVGGVSGAAVDQGGNIVGQLEGGGLGILLTDGHAEDVALVPLLAQLLGALRAAHRAGALGQLDSGALAQTELVGKVHQRVDAHAPPHVVEEIVAGDLDGLGHINQTVVAAVLIVDPAGGLGLDQ